MGYYDDNFEDNYDSKSFQRKLSHDFKDPFRNKVDYIRIEEYDDVKEWDSYYKKTSGFDPEDFEID